MTYYPEPTGNDTRGFTELFTYVNNVSDGFFFPAIMIVIWIVIFTGTKQYSTSRAWTTASVVCAFLSMPLVIIQLISPKWMYLLFILVAGGLVWLKIES